MDQEQFRPEDAAPAPPREPAQTAGSAAPQPGYPYDAEPPNAIEQNSDARTWGMLCHLGSLAGFVIPFGNIIGPLVCWLVKKDDYPFVDDQGKESLNFNITITIALVAVAAIGFATACLGVGVVILVVGLPAVGIFDLVVTVMAAIKSNSGEYYRYPINIRMIT
jgi:uncharacterized Tic20 family protein